MKIKKIDLSRLRNHEHFEFMRHIVDIVTDAGAEALRVVAQLATFVAALNKEDIIMVKASKSLFTTRINEADAVRDDLFHAIVNMVRAYSAHFNEDVRKAAERAALLLDTYGNVHRLAIEEDVYNLCKDFQEKYPEDVITLNLTQWISELIKSNNIVHDLMETRLEESAGKPQFIMKEVRAEVDAAYIALADMVFAQGLVTSLGTDAELIAKYETVASKWNGLIDRTDTIVAMRRGKAKAKKENEDAAAEEPQP